MKQTAVEWLVEKLRVEFGFSFSNNILEQAKEMEKQQIINAWELEGDEYVRTGKDYYEVTFNLSQQDKP